MKTNRWLVMLLAFAALSVGTGVGGEEEDRRLLSAASKGSIEDMEAALEAGADINATDESGNTPLHEVSDEHKIEPVRFLLGKGAEVNAKNFCGATPLLLAAKESDVESVRILLAAGASLNVTETREGGTALHHAIARRHGECYHRESRRRDETAGLLIEAGANVDATTYENVTPLHTATLNYRLHILNLLRGKHANIGAKTFEGNTPLHLAVTMHLNEEAISELVMALLDHGAPVNATNNAGNTPYKVAIAEGNGVVAGLVGAPEKK